MASTSLTRTVSSTGNTFKGTLSAWIKRSDISTEQYIFENYETSGNRFFVRFLSTGQLGMETLQGSSTVMQINTLNMFRDTSAWYHIVVGIDSTLATASDRVKVYINGVQQTSYNDETQPPQNQNMSINEGNPTYVTVGRKYGASNYFDGSMSHLHWIDGTQYAASDFGSTDSSTGQWSINASPSVTYGTNGFFVLKDGNGVTDQSGQSNNLAVAGGTLTNLQDNPSNVFATWNALKKLTVTLSNANTTTSGNGDNGVWGTIGDNQGKWYWETQQNANSVMMGIINEDVTQTTGRSQSAGAYGLQSGNGSYAYYRNNGSSGQSSGFPEITNSNVLCHALDLDNGKYYLGIDGVFKNLSGTTSNLGTGADPTFTGLDTTKFWFPFTESRGTGVGCDVNFGNGYFGTTAISSAGTNASNLGIFEYDVPAGYTAWCTKGLNE